MHKGRLDEAREVIALTHADGDTEHPVVLVQYREVIDTQAFERENGKTMSIAEVVKTPSARQRMWLVISVAIFSMLSGDFILISDLTHKVHANANIGNNIISYYLGTLLDNGGITNSTTQLEIVRL